MPGLGEPVAFGPAVENQPSEDLPLLDEIELVTDQDLEDPPPVAVFPVEDAAPIVRALPTEHPIVVAGDGDGLVAATAAGVIDPDRAILYGAGLLEDDDTEMFDTALADGADIVVTDSNRRRARRWGSIRENEGYTEMAGEEALEYEVGDARLDIFPTAGDDSFTVAVQRGGATVQASAYGNPVSYTPGDRAFFAVDGDPRTAWKVGAFSEVEGEYLRLTTDEPVTTDHVGLTQPLSSDINRWITEVELRFDGGDPVRVDLTEASRTEPGQVVEFPERTFSELEIEILGDTIGYRPKLAGVSAVGFAEVDLEGIRLEELMRPPVDVVDAAGDDLIDHRLSYVLQRQRTNPAEPVRVDEEPAMRRLLEVPGEREFELSGGARISAQAPDPLVDRILGIPSAARGGLTASSSEHLAGSLASRASSALDDDPTTAWTTPFNDLRGQFVEVRLPEEQTVDHLDLQIVADGRHSVPTLLRLRAGDETRDLHIPRLEPGGAPGAVQEVTVPFRAVESDDFRLTVLAVDRATTTDWYSGGPAVLPVAIAEMGLPGVVRDAPADEVGDRCYDDLLTVDGEPVPIRFSGSTADAEARLPLDVEACDGPIAAAGPTDVVAAEGRDTGFDLDALTLSSGPGGDAAPAGVTGTVPTPPEIDVETPRLLQYDATADTDEAFWLVVGQSYGPEWAASVEGGEILGHEIVSGFANGWYVAAERRRAGRGLGHLAAPAVGVGGHRHLHPGPAGLRGGPGRGPAAPRRGSPRPGARDQPAVAAAGREPPGQRMAGRVGHRRRRGRRLAPGHPLGRAGHGRRHAALAGLALGCPRRPPHRGGGAPRRQPVHLRQADDRQPPSRLRLAPELRRRPLDHHGRRPGPRRGRGGRADPPASDGCAVKRLAVGAVALVAVLVLAEVAARAVSPYLPEPPLWTDDTTTVKVAQLDALDCADLVFAGNSMTRDGLDPVTFEAADPEERSTYNAALDAATPALQERWVLDEVDPRVTPDGVVLGVSSFDLNDEAAIGQTALGAYDAAPLSRDDLFGRLQAPFIRTSDLFRYRNEIRDPETLWDGLQAWRDGERQPRLGPEGIEGVLGPRGPGPLPPGAHLRAVAADRAVRPERAAQRLPPRGRADRGGRGPAGRPGRPGRGHRGGRPARDRGLRRPAPRRRRPVRGVPGPGRAHRRRQRRRVHRPARPGPRRLLVRRHPPPQRHRRRGPEHGATRSAPRGLRRRRPLRLGVDAGR